MMLSSLSLPNTRGLLNELAGKKVQRPQASWKLRNWMDKRDRGCPRIRPLLTGFSGDKAAVAYC